MKDQGHALLDERSTPLVPDEDGPAIMAMTAPAVGEDGGTYKTSSKWVIHITTSTALISCW
jgi:hypothetical protein